MDPRDPGLRRIEDVLDFVAALGDDLAVAHEDAADLVEVVRGSDADADRTGISPRQGGGRVRPGTGGPGLTARAWG